CRQPGNLCPVRMLGACIFLGDGLRSAIWSQWLWSLRAVGDGDCETSWAARGGPRSARESPSHMAILSFLRNSTIEAAKPSDGHVDVARSIFA
ncbi:hypothetical protein, partial [Variovorax sp. LjRoot178]|uniref:hypothetical protein n=1 Tax=Variovorax sp. LjRoot178 TaxID=3342277 RepID=UPI003F515729